MLLTFIRLALLILSTLGWVRLAGRRIAPELSIGFAFAGIGSLMLLSGLLNLLPHMAAALLLGGLAALAYTVKRDGFGLRLTPGGAFFLVMCAVLLMRLWGEKLIHYDNFSHWGMAVRHLLAKDRFPNFSDPYIQFQSYPLGTASFIYYCARVTGIEAEWFQMFAQWACAAGLLSGLFCLAKNLPARVACGIGSALLICADNNFNQMLVDTMLACAALGALGFCLYYRDDMRRKALYLIPWLTWLAAVKNSGLLFIAFLLPMAFLWGGWKRGLMATAAPVIVWRLWNRHVAYVFRQGMMAQHSLSLDNFRRMLSAKRPGSVQSIVTQMLQRVFSLQNEILPVLLLSAAMFAFTLIFVKRARLVRGLLIYGAAAYLIYQAGTLGMYVFTMNEQQALQLASYPRYHGTIWIYCAGVTLAAALMLCDQMRDMAGGRRWTAACCVLCAAALALSGMPNYTHYTRYLIPEYQEKLAIREEVDAVIADYGLPEGAGYYVLVGNDFAPTPYLTQTFNCLLLAGDVQVRRLNQLIVQGEAEKYDYVIAFEQTPEVMAWMEEHLGTRDRVVDMTARA